MRLDHLLSKEWIVRVVMLLSFQEMREIRKRQRCELAHRKMYFEYRAYGASHQSTRSDNGEEIGHFVIKESIKICRW